VITAQSKLDPQDPLWILNQYRAAEVHGAGAIMRMGRLADTASLRADLSRHLRDEAVHAWLWSRTITDLGGEIVEVDQPYQARLSQHFGIPGTLTDMLALTLVSERRGLTEYESHVDELELPDSIRRTLRGIIRDEDWHVRYITEELDRRRREDSKVAAVLERAEAADLKAVEELERESVGPTGW
jgi:rubrerythrin